jgi:ABC-2 type transport system ATP-binding protein
MISVKGVTKRFGRVTAVQELNCNVDACSVYGLVGYNGAGKTTLLKTIAGIYRPEGGRVLIEGENIYENQILKRRLFLVPDEPYFLSQASLNRMAGFYKGYYPTWNDKTFKKLTEIFDLDPRARINSFSKGMQRQAAILLALAAQPQYLLLDESFDGLDPARRSLVKRIILEFLAEKEISVVISSHNLRELEDLCDHIGLINGKKLLLDCSVDEMRQSRNKYRVAFKNDVKPEDFTGMDLKKLAVQGRLITFITAGSPEQTQARLAPLEPLLFESVPMTIEEIFLDEMEVKDYDLHDLF